MWGRSFKMLIRRCLSCFLRISFFPELVKCMSPSGMSTPGAEFFHSRDKYGFSCRRGTDYGRFPSQQVEGDPLCPAVNYGAIKSFPIESMMNELFCECPSSPIYPVFIANRPASNLCAKWNMHVDIHLDYKSDASVGLVCQPKLNSWRY